LVEQFPEREFAERGGQTARAAGQGVVIGDWLVWSGETVSKDCEPADICAANGSHTLSRYRSMGVSPYRSFVHYSGTC
jgi:hypothetical protein